MEHIILFEDDEDELKLPARYEVCRRCDGKGTHVNPAVDGHGISPEEFVEDPDFEEAYFSGRYDVNCYECSGKCVVLVVYEELCTENDLKIYHQHLQDEATDRAIETMELRMGA